MHILITKCISGPPRRAPPGGGKTGPTTEEKLDSVTSSLEQYEDKMKEMKRDMESHNKEANKRLEGKLYRYLLNHTLSACYPSKSKLKLY